METTDTMAKKMLIDATHAEETRVVVVDGNKVEEFDFESENKRQLAGNIYLAKVTRVEPSLQAAFVDYGGNRHGFLAFSEIHPDYYQIPVADREALLEEERAYAESLKARDEEDEKPQRRRRSRAKSKAEKTETEDAVASIDPSGMETIDLDDEERASDDVEGLSPMETVGETPVEEGDIDDADETADADEDGAVDASAAIDTTEDEGAEHADELDGDNADDDGEEEAKDGRSKATDKDDNIESVADDDDAEDIRPPRKPRPRRYKIQEVINVRQILLIQVVKEERGNKGAALTTYLSLAGRYCVLMPNTARGGGISRKITNAADRKKLKDIASEIDVPSGAGLIVRTAGAKRTKSEIKRDYEYLQRLWEQIRELTLKSIAPAKIYEEGDLVKRSIRDLYNREIDEVLVEGERGYRIAKDFMKMIMPSHAKNVKQYQESLPLFARYQVESYLSGMFNPTVQLKSGGYIVIGVTEALVAVDVNSGRATKEGSIEDTALKTNLEAAEEVARQLRLRDLAGLIVIDFIDMDERKNNSAVEKRLKEKLKSDRARIQVGRISGFGLLEMSRQRLRPGMIEATTQPCPACHGTGLIRSDDNMALSILRQIEEEGVRRRSREVLIKAPVAIVNYLMNQKREHVAQIEARYGLSVRIEGDPMLVSPDFSMEKFKTATRIVPEASAPVVSADSSIMEQVDEEESADAQAIPAEQDQTDEEDKPKKRRRRRRRKPRSQRSNGEDRVANEANSEDGEAPSDASGDETPQAEVDADAGTTDTQPKPKRSRSRRKPASKRKVTADAAEVPEATSESLTVEAEPNAEAEEKPKPKRKRSRAKKKPEDAPSDAAAEPEVTSAAEDKPKPKRTRKKKADAPKVAEATVETPAAVSTAQSEMVTADANVETPPDPDKPKRKGWWSLGRS